MKIYTSVVIDMQTGQVLEEESYEYDGPVDQCLGGGSTGSASSSGKIDYPQYIKTWHQWMLGDTQNMCNSARIKIPTTYKYDPRTMYGFPDTITPYGKASELSEFDAFADFDDVMDYSEFSARVLVFQGRMSTLWDDLIGTDAYGPVIQEAIDSASAQLLNKVNTDVIPKIDAAFRDAGAVVGSSMPIAKAIAMSEYTRQVSDITSKLHVHAVDIKSELLRAMLQLDAAWMEAYGNFAAKRVGVKTEALNLKFHWLIQLASATYEAMGKYANLQTEDGLRQGTWALDINDHMNKTLAAISGASTIRQGENRGANQFSAGSVIASTAIGAAAGMKMGTAMGGPQGTAIGGIVGAGVGLLGGLLK